MKKFNPRQIKNIRAANTVLKLFFHEKKSAVPPDIKRADNILIIDPTLIGDIVMLTPFLRILRKNNNHCRVTLAGGKWAKTVLEAQNLVDEFIAVDTNFLNSPRNLFFDRKKLKQFTDAINTKEYDYALEPRGDLRYIYFMHHCKAKRKVSYNYTGGECLLTDVITPSDSVKHLVEDKIYFIKSLSCGYGESDIYPKLVLSASQKDNREKFIADNNLGGKIKIGIHPGASLDIKQWTHYGELLAEINANIKNAVFIIFLGPGEEKIVNEVRTAAENCGAEYIISATPLDEYMTRISACDLMICNDSGAGHLAAAYGIAAFVIFGPYYPEFARPYSNKNVFCFSENVSCKPCFSRVCLHNNNECLNMIKIESVLNSILSYIKNNTHE